MPACSFNAGCSDVSSDQLVTCLGCPVRYHLSCTGISIATRNGFMQEMRNNFHLVCDTCRGVTSYDMIKGIHTVTNTVRILGETMERRFKEQDRLHTSTNTLTSLVNTLADEVRGLATYCGYSQAATRSRSGGRLPNLVDKLTQSISAKQEQSTTSLISKDDETVELRTAVEKQLTASAGALKDDLAPILTDLRDVTALFNKEFVQFRETLLVDVRAQTNPNDCRANLEQMRNDIFDKLDNHVLVLSQPVDNATEARITQDQIDSMTTTIIQALSPATTLPGDAPQDGSLFDELRSASLMATLTTPVAASTEASQPSLGLENHPSVSDDRDTTVREMYFRFPRIEEDDETQGDRRLERRTRKRRKNTERRRLRRRADRSSKTQLGSEIGFQTQTETDLPPDADTWIHISNIKNDTTVKDVRNYMWEKIRLSDVECHMLLPRDVNPNSRRTISFKLRIPIRHSCTVLDNSFWPDGIIVRRFLTKDF